MRSRAGFPGASGAGSPSGATRRRPRYQAGARFKGGPKGPPALLHAKSTRRSVWRRSFSCSLEQHQCRPSCRASAHTTHSPAACRCRRSSGRLDHRASALKSHASAAFRAPTAAYPRSVARRCASFRQPACRLCSSAATNGCPQISHGRPPLDRIGEMVVRMAEDRRQLETPGRSHLAVRRARRQRLVNRGCLRVRADGTDPRHLDKIPPKPTETGRPASSKMLANSHTLCALSACAGSSMTPAP